MIARGVVVGAAFVSLFMLPVVVSALVVACAALAFPPAGIALGMLYDVLYSGSLGTTIPYGTLFGVLATGLSLLVHRFIKARIMDA